MSSWNDPKMTLLVEKVGFLTKWRNRASFWHNYHFGIELAI